MSNVSVWQLGTKPSVARTLTLYISIPPIKLCICSSWKSDLFEVYEEQLLHVLGNVVRMLLFCRLYVFVLCRVVSNEWLRRLSRLQRSISHTQRTKSGRRHRYTYTAWCNLPRRKWITTCIIVIDKLFAVKSVSKFLGKGNEQNSVHFDGQDLSEIDKFVYLWGVISTGESYT